VARTNAQASVRIDRRLVIALLGLFVMLR